MQQREAEMDAMAAKKTEELMVQLRALRKQKDESEEQAEKASVWWAEARESCRTRFPWGKYGTLCGLC